MDAYEDEASKISILENLDEIYDFLEAAPAATLDDFNTTIDRAIKLSTIVLNHPIIDRIHCCGGLLLKDAVDDLIDSLKKLKIRINKNDGYNFEQSRDEIDELNRVFLFHYGHYDNQLEVQKRFSGVDKYEGLEDALVPARVQDDAAARHVGGSKRRRKRKTNRKRNTKRVRKTNRRRKTKRHRKKRKSRKTKRKRKM